MNNIEVVYTMWANLKKTQGMDVGQVGFFKDKEVTKSQFRNVAMFDNHFSVEMLPCLILSF